jgi:hypothetical protein
MGKILVNVTYATPHCKPWQNFAEYTLMVRVGYKTRIGESRPLNWQSQGSHNEAKQVI